MTRVFRGGLGLSLVVIAVLALGVGANTALFSIVDRVLLHPLPIHGLDRLVRIEGVTRSGRRTNNAAAESDFFAAHVRAFHQTAVWKWRTLVLTGVENPDDLPALEVGEHLFDILGAAPQLGHTFLSSDFRSTAAPVVVISDRLWRLHFRADPGILGRQILLDGRGYTVVGVMGAAFFFDRPAYQLWIPYRSDLSPAEELRHYFGSIARLRAGVSLAQAQREVDALTLLLPPDPEREAGWHAQLEPLAEQYTGPYVQIMGVLWVAVGLVLLIACANAGNLLLVRASERRREFAIRMSLGAGRLSLVRQIIAETLLLGVAAGVAGAALAHWFLRLLIAFFPERSPISQLDRVTLNINALALTAGLVFITTLLCAIPPCVSACRSTAMEALNAVSRTASVGRGMNRARSAMVAIEVALSLLLLIGAGLLLHTMARLLQVHLGFEPQNVLTARVGAPPRLSKQQQGIYYSRILAGVRTLPQVRKAAITTVLPFGPVLATVSFHVEGQGTPEWRTYPVYLREISPEYFSTLGMRLQSGRDFAETDTARAPSVVIVNDALARHYWPGQDPIGMRISGKDNPNAEDWSTVVGVVESIKHRSLKTGADAELYVPYTQKLLGASFTSLVIRTDGDRLSIAAGLQRRVHEIEPDQPVTDIKTMQTLVAASSSDVRFHTLLLEIFAAIALALAVIGIFAVISYSVTQRSREIGLRGALGASRRDIVRFVLGMALGPVVIGTMAGVLAGLSATRVLRSELFETAPADPVVFAGVVVILLLTALTAASIPAWRAARIDPAEMLRAE
jgi:predicted permease